MRKKILVICITFILIFTGCNTKGKTTQRYLDALENMENVKSMEEQLTVDIKIDTKNATEEIKKEFEGYENINIAVDTQQNWDVEKLVSDIYIKLKSISLYSKFYIDGENVFLKTPLFEEYILLNETQMQDKVSDTISPEVYEQIFKDFALVWREAVRNEIMESEGDTVVNTPDGDMKVKILTLELDDMRSKKIINELVKNISKNEDIKKMILENIEQNGQIEETEEVKQKVIEGLDKLPMTYAEIEDKYTIEEIKIVAKLDRDDYIIEDMSTFKIHLLEQDITISVTTNAKRWNINQPIEIEIPSIQPEDMITPEEINMEDMDAEQFKSILH